MTFVCIVYVCGNLINRNCSGKLSFVNQSLAIFVLS